MDFTKEQLSELICIGIPEQGRPVIPAYKGQKDARSPIKNR